VARKFQSLLTLPSSDSAWLVWSSVGAAAANGKATPATLDAVASPVQQDGMADTLRRLEKMIRERRVADPALSYVASLFAKGRAKMAQKVGEEATETVIAAMQGDATALTSEAADLIFHMMILLEDSGISIDAVLSELERREGVSGHQEKAARRP
jgi:phosphoribosyl-ATP pyrophosphohydrolase